MKLYIDTLGCPKNFNDSEGAAGICEAAGIGISDDPFDADAILINTCGFINDAKRESIDRIFELADIKDDGGRDRILIVSGCLSQRYGSSMEDWLYDQSAL